MSDNRQSDWIESDASVRDESPMVVELGGYEGPLDLLLDLARRQKVDLSGISMLQLAEQYLAFIAGLRDRRIDLAADYLVMAAWLAYLKSRLLVPQTPASGDEPSGEMLAAMLQFRLRRLEAMRAAAARLLSRPRRGVSVAARGDPEPVALVRRSVWSATLYDLLKAYAAQRERKALKTYTPKTRTVWALQEAREILARLVGTNAQWAPLETYLAQYLITPLDRASVIASGFSASLELTNQGHIELHQSLAFGPLLVRRKQDEAVPVAKAVNQ